MRLSVRNYSGITTPIEVFRCKVDQLHNFNIHADNDCEVGDETLVIGSGEPLTAGGNWGYTHQDFRPNATGDIIVYVGASSAASVHVTSWLER
jgi:hypothetical protein